MLSVHFQDIVQLAFLVVVPKLTEDCLHWYICHLYLMFYEENVRFILLTALNYDHCFFA